jgi:hypothetical protein
MLKLGKKYMNEIELKNEFLSYPESLLEAWKLGDYSILTHSNASDYIKEILTFKAKTRIGRRFFGEAYTASKIEMNEGWYNSFKWLTADKWISGHRLEPKFEKPFHNALMKHIGPDIIKRLQKNTIDFYNRHKEKFMDGDRYKKPVAPDLWLIDKEGGFKFIESKLPGDTISPHQIAGLALIVKYLRVSVPVSVSIMHLYPENIDPVNLFSEFYNLA